MDPVAVRGVAAFLIASTVFFGSIYLLLSMVLGFRLAYWVEGSTLFGIFIILSAIWFGTGLGPKGPETTWHPVGIGPDLTSVQALGDTYDVAGYPGQGWEEPRKGHTLADLKNDTASELENARPVLDAFVGTAVSPIPGKRKTVESLVKGTVELKPGKFHVVDVRMKQAQVEGKESVIAVGKVVPSETLLAATLGPGVTDAVVDRYLVKAGDAVTPGKPILVAKTDSGATVQVASEGSTQGRVITLGLRTGDKVKAGIPIATVDVSGQSGMPAPAEVAAVRVRGSVRTPALYYMVASFVLFALHMLGLSRVEKGRRTAPQPA